MIAAVLHLDKGAGMIGTRDRRKRYAVGVEQSRDTCAGLDLAIGQVHAERLQRSQRARNGRLIRRRKPLHPIANHFGHARKHRRINFCRAASDENPRIGAALCGTADGLTCLTRRFGGYRARIDDDQIILAARRHANRLALGDVQPAAKVDHLNAQPKSSHSASPL